MTVHKKYLKSFTIVSNEIFRYGLSLKAIGLYTYILNKPDGWEFSIRGTATQLKDGKDAIRSAVHELEEKGFLRRGQVRQENGQFSDGEWYIYDTPIAENPMSENTMSENRPQVNKNKVNTNKEIIKEIDKEKKEKPSLKEIPQETLQQIALDYQVPLAFVSSKYEDMVLWATANGKLKKDWVATLRNFVKKDALKIRKDQHEQRKTIAFIS